MVNKQLLNYIQKSLEGGSLVEQIREALDGQGWNSIEINEALLKAQENIQQKAVAPVASAAPPKKLKGDIKLKNLSASRILLYLGGLIIVLAGIIYIGINWSQWRSEAWILAIFLPMFICYMAGTRMFFSREYKNQGIVFVVVGSLLFPLFLSVAFKELELFIQPFNVNFNLIVSLLTFVLYLGFSFVFSFPIWAFLYQGAGLFLYYYSWKFLGVVETAWEPTFAWLFLIPGTAYLFFSLLYDRLKKKDEAYFSYILGTLVLIVSFGQLLFSKEYSPWLFILFGFAYFSFGAGLEMSKKKYFSAPYWIGAILIFFSFLHFGFEGTFLKGFFTGSAEYNQDIVGWSNVITGVVYLLIAWLVSKLKKFQMKEGAWYKEFFNPMGSLFFLGAIFYLGLHGKKLVYETLLLLSSLGFIFGSIPKRSRQFLYTGTLFLVIYIFSIGGEYFKDDAGWPIILFITGLISMGIGVVIERIRRIYFVASKIEQ